VTVTRTRAMKKLFIFEFVGSKPKSGNLLDFVGEKCTSISGLLRA
jgi:hypothetical protein